MLLCFDVLCFKLVSIIGKVSDYEFFLLIDIYLFSGTYIDGQERPKLRPNRTVTEVNRDRIQI